MRLGRRLSTGIAEDPPAPGAEQQRPVTSEQAEHVERAEPEVRREYAEAAER